MDQAQQLDLLLRVSTLLFMIGMTFLFSGKGR